MIVRRQRAWWLLAAAAVAAAPAPAKNVVRAVMLPENLSADNVNIRPVQPIDSAAWIWSDGPGDVRLFRRRFVSGAGVFRVHVSADNRYLLKLDGERIARGPERGTVERWTYRTLELSLDAGEHVLEAVAWRKGAPLAQLEWWKSPGFIFKAEGALDAELTTGRADWRAKAFDNVADGGELNGTFGVGASAVVNGDSPWYAAPADSELGPVKVVRGPVEGSPYGIVLEGWRLVPTTLPMQYSRTFRPGEVRATARSADRDYVFRAEDAGGAFPEEVPANSELVVLWDLGDYYCAYPELETSGGAGARVEFGWAESLVDAKTGLKRDRAEFAGKRARCFTDVFLPDGGDDGFTAKWWRAGRWVRLAFKTADEPLKIRSIAITETRYPTPYTARFECDDDTLPPVLAMAERTLQMCSHEMSFDCPYYEQQMYPGDTRLQLLTHYTLAADDRLARRDMELYDLSRRDNGLVGFNFPTRGVQDGGSYTFMWPMMLADYAMWRADAAWLRSRLPGLLHTMEGLRRWENADGLVADLPGWNFQDWCAWPQEGCAGGSKDANGTNCLNNLLYVYSLKSAATVADALGEPGFAAVYRDRAARTAAAAARLFWDDARGLLADDVAHVSFSEHCQALAISLDALDGDRAERCAKGLLGDPDLVRCTVYFSHYLFDAYAKLGRTDLFLKRLDLWRGYLAKHLKTAQESPDDMRYGLSESRSDCHAWGAHPVYHLHADVLGLRPAAPFFGAVRIAPQPGGLRFIRSATPTPRGDVVCDLSFSADGGVAGAVSLPAGMSGEFVYGGRTVRLAPGVNKL